MFYTKMETKGTPNSFKSRGVHCARIRVCGFAPSRAPRPPAPDPRDTAGSRQRCCCSCWSFSWRRTSAQPVVALLTSFLSETQFECLPARPPSHESPATCSLLSPPSELRFFSLLQHVKPITIIVLLHFLPFGFCQ